MERPSTTNSTAPVTRNSFTPSIITETQIPDEVPEKENIDSRMVKLTNENAAAYAGISSYVGWRGRVDYALDYIEKDSESNANLLACLLDSVISTVIILASGGTPPNEYLISAGLFLKYVINEFGEQPPNIAALLKYIETLEDVPAVLQSILNLEIEDELPPNLVITQVPKSLQKRICK